MRLRYCSPTRGVTQVVSKTSVQYFVVLEGATAFLFGE